MAKAKSILIVLDGFGIGKDSPFNAIKNAQMPFFKGLLEKYPSSQLLTHGLAVGLPEGVMGNSEVGHMTMGAGRIIYQDLTRISRDIWNKDFFKNKNLLSLFNRAAHSRLHLMGLLSDGGVHSHIDHLKALLTMSMEQGIPDVSVHLFMDGRDTPPKSGVNYVRDLLTHPAFSKNAKIATVSGRYFAMDRDKRWERVEKAYLTLTGQVHPTQETVEQAILGSYQNGKTDEFIEPLCFDPKACVKDGDAILFFNYRSDRARELTEAFTSADFSGFKRHNGQIKLSGYAGMTQYDSNLNSEVIFGPQNLDHLFGEHLETLGLSQFRIAETEKYAHVTFFFNGGREKPFQGEDRVLIPSPKEVATYDLKPEMSAFAVANGAREKIEAGKHDFMLMNFANADMVGHTGNYKAAVLAMEALDKCLETVIGAAERNGYHVLLTADHGNAEEMCDASGEIHTQHTLNPVPALWIAPQSALAPKRDRKALLDGTLADVMPTLCSIMGLSIPKEVTGKNLLGS